MTDSASPAQGPLTRLSALIAGWQAGLQQWVSDHHDTVIQAVVGTLVAFATVQQHLRGLERWEGTEWEHLLSRTDFIGGISLLAVLNKDGAPGVYTILEAALATSEAAPRLAASIEHAGLAESHRRQLQEGLRHVSRRDYVLAVPLLIIALEGAISLHAEQQGLVERSKGKLRFTDESGRLGYVKGAEDLFRIEELGFDGAFREYLNRAAYGDSGNQFRHGTAVELDYRPRALALTVAVLSWVDGISDAPIHGGALAGALRRITHAQLLTATGAQPTEMPASVAALAAMQVPAVPDPNRALNAAPLLSATQQA